MATAVDVSATAFAFDVPAEVTGGVVEMQFTNTGGLPHEFAFARIEQGKTEADVKAVIESGEEPPEWAEDVAGVPGLSPGQSITVTRTLEPGSYVFLCFFPDPEGTPHANLGMYELLTIAGDTGAALPEPDATITATDDGLQVPALTSGEQSVEFENGGTEPHELALVAFEPGKGIKDVDRWFGSGYQGQPPVNFLGGMQTIPAGESVFLTIDPRAGRGIHGPRLHDGVQGDVHGLPALTHPRDVGTQPAAVTTDGVLCGQFCAGNTFPPAPPRRTIADGGRGEDGAHPTSGVPDGVGWTIRSEGVMTERRSRMPWVAWVIGMLALAVTLALVALNHSYGEDAIFIPLAVAVTIGWTTVGAMVASRTPGNPTGWLMIAVGVSFVIGGVGSEYATYALQTSPEVLPLASFAAWLSEWINVVLVAAVPLLLMVFPTGHLPSPRWRPLAWLIVGLSVIAAAGILVEPRAIQVTGEDFVPNPIGVAELERLLDLVLPMIGIAILLASLGAVASVVVRFRRSRGEERQQLRWFAYAVALGAGLLICVLLSSLGSQAGEVRPASEVFSYAFLVAVGVGLPAAIGIAMLKYRLYDLDIVLRKTVIVTVVAAFITVVFLGALVVATVGGGFLLAVPLLLLAFDPVRKRARSVADRVVYGKRATPYEVITSFSERMAETYSTDDVLPRMAQVLQGATGASAATVWLRVGREMRPAASSPANGREEPQSIAEDGLPSLPADLAEEVRHQGDLLGALTVSMPPNDPIDPPRSKLVRDFAAQAGLVLRNVRLIEELRESRRRIVSAQDERAKALERNIHDGAQQQLVALAVKQRLAASLVHRDPDKTTEILAELQSDTAEALQDLRDLARGIYPPLLADKGLAVALEAQARKALISTEVQADSIGRYPQEVEAAVYFCCLEALQNATKYAGASKMSLRLWERDGELVFSAADDGRGFDKQAASLGAGLQNMSDRISALGGTLEVSSQPGAGVTVTGRIPPEPRAVS